MIKESSFVFLDCFSSLSLKAFTNNCEDCCFLNESTSYMMAGV